MRQFLAKDDFGLAALVAVLAVGAMVAQSYSSEHSTIAMEALAVAVATILLAVTLD